MHIGKNHKNKNKKKKMQLNRIAAATILYFKINRRRENKKKKKSIKCADQLHSISFQSIATRLQCSNIFYRIQNPNSTALTTIDNFLSFSWQCQSSHLFCNEYIICYIHTFSVSLKGNEEEKKISL